MLSSALSVTGIVLAAIAFVVLFVIISIPLWISLLVAAGVLLVTALMSGGTAAARDRHGHPSHG